MKLTIEQIRAAALELNPVDRERLAEDLLLSIVGDDRRAIHAAWLAEAQLRTTAYRAGLTTARPTESFISTLARRFPD